MGTRNRTRAKERINTRPSVKSSEDGQPKAKKTKGESKDRADHRRSFDRDASAPKEGEAAPEENIPPVDLSPMIVMPLDIFQEVLSHLHPRDLILVSRVSKRFREHLLLRNSTVWKMSRERIGVPDGPSQLSEAAWAALLFIPRCQMCGEKDIQLVDFFILRRLCSRCREKSLVDQHKLKTEHPQYPIESLELVPYTVRHILFRSTLSQCSSRYYFLEDIKQVALRLQNYKDTSPWVGQENTKLDIFKEYQKAKIRTIHKTAPSYQSWYHNYYLKQHIHGNILSL